MSRLTDEQIRDHIQSLREALKKPCSCRTRSQKRRCEAGRQLLITAVEVLTWALGENSRYEEVAADMARWRPNPFLQNRIIRFEREEPKDG